ncbi:MAG: Ig-like domain-containing protein, partial [Anaerolineae bacterium]|nr:Ig-like domain-containing protein [Thermoflexales bacterium]MDW8407005.1 Ig-like domain-containing protein [Anaerolineae bacterium]
SNTVAGSAIVTATAGGVSASVSITYLAEPSPALLALAVSPAVIYANGISQSIVMAQTQDRFGNPTSGVPVAFASGVGVLVPDSGTTDGAGRVWAVLTSSVPAVDRISAMAVTLRAERPVTYTNPPANQAPLTGTLRAAPSGSQDMRRGDVITYSLIITNAGQGQLNNVLIVAPIPSGTTYVSGSLQGGNFIGNGAGALAGNQLLAPQHAQNVVSWSGNLPPGASHALIYAVRIHILEGAIVNRLHVFIDNTDTGLNLTQIDHVIAYKAYVPAVQQ